MAGGTFTLFNKGKLKIVNSTIDFDGNTVKAVLTTVTQALTASFVGSSTDCRYSDLTNELSTANGYTAGGVAVSGASITETGGTVTVTCSAISWTLTGTITCYYIVLYDDTASNKPLIGFALLDATPASISPIAGTFTINPNASGLFTAA